jgi:peptidyl-prolyl cis-trans isomerase D
LQTRNAQGFSPKAIGAIFNNANKGKLINQPFEAANSIVVIRVDDITTTSVITGELETQKAQVRMATKSLQMQYSSPIRIMRNIANIKDNRRKFY